MANRSRISILSLSQNRMVIRAVHAEIQPHGFAIGGILESDPFSPKDLALALKILEPRPQAMLVGRGYSEEEAEVVRIIFAQFKQNVSLDDGIVIKITNKVFDEVGKEGVPKWVLHQLQDHFDKEVVPK
ncbi:hypothetical protein F4820DRAFT_437836 [Hypoxylon rubiginosum]|uniref:Uncharacterized protein n=1 Tax=Hypoxylon rubiginosum TaxID=110542 RepID=A0ACB9YL40_9PEZI|nr:hypothetical protein F4820DRAFT_437836 [Hypoxylon rubiginosum]